MTQRHLHIALLQMDIALGKPDENYANLERMLDRAMQHTSRPDVILFPEMWNTGYALDRIDELADRAGERTIAFISRYALTHQVNIVAGSIADHRGEHMYNTTYVCNRSGEVIADYSKIHLFRLMNEHQHLTSGTQVGQMELDGIPSAMMICYDIRFPELARKLALGGAQLLFVSAEWPHPRLHHWRTLLMARAIENQMYVIACNRVGTSDGTEFFGHSLIINPWGEILAEGSEQEEIIHKTIDLDLVPQVRNKIPIFEDRRPEMYA